MELGLGFLVPLYLLLIIGFSPGTAGLALIPATVPIIVVAPLAGRWFDRAGGRAPLTAGFLTLAVSSFVPAAAAQTLGYAWLIPSCSCSRACSHSPVPSSRSSWCGVTIA